MEIREISFYERDEARARTALSQLGESKKNFGTARLPRGHLIVIFISRGCDVKKKMQHFIEQFTERIIINTRT